MAVEPQFKVINQKYIDQSRNHRRCGPNRSSSASQDHQNERNGPSFASFLPAHVGYGTGYSVKRSNGSLQLRIVGEVNGGCGGGGRLAVSWWSGHFCEYGDGGREIGN
eukprot:scaffold33742_cov115-Cyclotella_meneghiniana.AAC.4